MKRRPSPNFDDRPASVPVDMLVLHYTGMQSAEAALERLCDASAKVSAHYVIEQNGELTGLVGEDKRAWHAGVSYWRGYTDINARSIGIELVNPGHEFGYKSFSEKQITALTELAHDILSRHPIEPRNVVGHSDVAPQRKTDPGELFPWKRLAENGIGVWPETVSPDNQKGDIAELLAGYGYETEDMPASITAFQRHFRQDRIDGEADNETKSLLQSLLDRMT